MSAVLVAAEEGLKGVSNEKQVGKCAVTQTQAC